MSGELQAAVVDFPAPAPPADCCRACDGSGLSGERYRFQARPGDHVLLVDVLCRMCFGCGRADHREGCPAPEHHPSQMCAEFDLDDNADVDLDEDLTGGTVCPFCRGREWFPVVGWNTHDGEPVDDQVVEMKMPCGCTGDRMRTVTVGIS